MAYSLIRSRRRRSHAHNRWTMNTNIGRGITVLLLSHICVWIHQPTSQTISLNIYTYNRKSPIMICFHIFGMSSYLSRVGDNSFITLPLGRIPRYTHVSLKTPSKNPVGEKDRRKEYIVHASYIALVASLKTLREKYSSKNSLRKKNTTHDLLDRIIFKIDYSS